MTHVVQQGEYLAMIAKKHGFTDYMAIWNHPQNADLKKKRQNPNILYPGDELFVPEKEEKKESVATEQRHKFTVTSKPLKFRLILKDLNFQPLANRKCILHINGEKFELTSKSNGLVEQDIPPTAQQARLLVEDDRTPITLEVPIRIGHLDPLDTVSGQKARLNNLGYVAGPLDEDDDGLFKSAVEEFQCDQKLTVDGVCGHKTQDKLREVYGC